MCGFAGIYHPFGAPPGEWPVVVERMTRTLVHRGPDDEGYFVDGAVALGHRRLRVIDLETGHQPLTNEDGTLWTVFNGEIYNYIELNKLLAHKGHVFRTRCDTETILHAYEEWGVACLDRLRGMFAFALWDQRRQQLVLARDRLGKKPLYYATVGDAFVFGSEIKALRVFPGLNLALDLQAVSDYLTLLYIPGEKSIFQQVRKLPPGHYLTADRNGVRVRRYWDLRFSVRMPADEPAAAERLAELLEECVALRLRSDVPLGAFLSGGLDSSTVVALMAEAGASPLVTASIGFSEKAFDERPSARLVARRFGAEHHERVLTPGSIMDAVEKLIWHCDEPFGDSSIVPTYYVAQVARAHVTVALSGDGGDENFAGYQRYQLDVKENTLRAIIPGPLRRVLGVIGAVYPQSDFLPRYLRAKTFLSNLSRAPWEAYLHSVSGIHEADKIRLLTPDVRRALAAYRTADLFADLYRAADGPDPLSRIQYIDFKTYLPDDILAKVDRAAMANSLEVRCPFLDHHLVEYVASLPATLKLRGTRSKVILKEALRGRLPEQILTRKKMGFAPPVGRWLRTGLYPLVRDHLLVKAHHDLFDVETVRTLWREHESGWRDRTAELWGILMFNIWYERFRCEPPATATPSAVSAEQTLPRPIHRTVSSGST